MNDQDTNYEEVSMLDVENEEDLKKLELKTFSQAVVTSTDWTAQTILNQLERGNIILNPKFQRRDAWREVHKSKFIESIILGLPIPQLVLAESKSKKGSYIVIDGKQRLLSIRQFATKEGDELYERLKLKSLEFRKDLNGKSYIDLQEDPNYVDDLNAFENQSIRTVVIKNWPSEEFLYLVFLRLNTGSVQLSPQELRQALHPGRFIDFVDDFSEKSKILQKTLGLNKPDFRMRDVEILVRYYAFRNFLKEYNGNLKEFLDLTCEKLNKEWEIKEDIIKEESEEFEKALKVTHDIFGKNAFRKWENTKFENRFNRAVFDIMVFYFADPVISDFALKKKAEVVELFKWLCTKNVTFKNSLETTTKSIEATYNRLSIWGNELSNKIGCGMVIPKLEDNRIVF